MNFTIHEIQARLAELRLSQNEANEAPASEIDISLADAMSESTVTIPDSDMSVHGLVLAMLPLDEWDFIPVSPLSCFGEDIWDFSSYPSATKDVRVYFNYMNHYGFNLVKESIHWVRILKALLIYRIPRYSFSGRNRAHGSSIVAGRNKFLPLVKFFQHFGLYEKDTHEGFPDRVVDDLSKETVYKYMMELPTAAKRWDFSFVLQYWGNLSRSGMLPPIYSVSTEFFSNEEVSKLRREMDDTAIPFEPIPLDDFAELVAYSASMVNDYSDDLLWLARTYYPTLIGRGVDRAPAIADGLSLSEPAGVAAFLEYQPRMVNGEPWWTLAVLERKHPNDNGKYVSYAQVSAYVQGLLDCCVTIIFATTGMRRSEVRALKVNCTETDQAGHWLLFTVFKTSVASQGDSKRIPIPQVTFKAIEVLRKLCAQSREFGQHDYLLSCINRAFFGRNPNEVFAERALARVAESCGVTGSIHPHRFRKSLAMYIIYQDSRNIELIRQLFSHKSLRMTLRYLISLPGINDELKRYLVEKNTEILAEVMTAAASGCIGGKGGHRVRESLADSKTFSARLQDSGKETIEQYVDSLLDSGVNLLHRTNLAICIRSPSMNDSVPCVGKNETAAGRLHPNLFACDPFNCNFAVFTEGHVEGLINEIKFHERMLAHPYCGTEQADYSTRRVGEANRRLSEVRGRADSQISGSLYGQG